MYRYVLSLFFFFCFCSGTLWAQDIIVKNTDLSQWPTVRITLEKPGKEISSESYLLSFPFAQESIKPDKIVRTANQVKPPTMVIAVDTSRSLSSEHLQAAKDALARYVDELDQGEQVSLLAFNDNVQLASGFTSDREVFKNTLEQLRLGGQKTELYRAMLYGIELLQSIPGQRSLLVITDGKDEGTAIKKEQVLAAARDHEVRLSCIGLTLLPDQERSKYLPLMQDLTKASGGLYRNAGSVEELRKATYELLVEERDQSTYMFTLVYTIPQPLLNGMPARTEALLSRRDGNETHQVGTIDFVVPRIVPEPRTANALDESAASMLPENESSANEVVKNQELRNTSAVSSDPSQVNSPTLLAKIWPWLLAAALLLLLLLYLLRKKLFSDQVIAPVKQTQQESAPLYMLEFEEFNHRYRIKPGVMSVAASPENTVLVNDPEHDNFKVEFFHNGGCKVRNLNSTHPVLLNGKTLIGTTEIKLGDILSFGSINGIIRLAEDSDYATTHCGGSMN